MKYEHAKQISENAIQQLAESLERGHSEELRNYLCLMAKFPRYSLNNILLIVAQKPAASRVAGYRTWQQLGRFVKRGAKGILIFAPIVRRAQNANDNADQSLGHRVLGFQAVYVFDEADTDGQQLATLATCEGDPQIYTERLKAFLLSRGIAFECSESILPAQGQCSRDKIVLVPNLSPAVEFSTLAHELGHHLLHFGSRRAETTKKIRETEAEAVAFVVSTAIGLEATRSASDYISLYSGDKNLLYESLEHIQHASAEIITAITPPE